MKALEFRCLHDKQEIERYLTHDVYLNIYGIGDLDDFFWPATTWYALQKNRRIVAVVLVYAGPVVPTVLALSHEPESMRELLSAAEYLLPYKFYAHLSPGVETALLEHHTLSSHGLHLKMAITTPPKAVDSSVVRLETKDLAEIQAFYEEAYPDTWFDPRMLESGQYVGLYHKRNLASIAGIHVYSPRYRVAALGNIATHPLYRKKEYAAQATGALCKSLYNEGMKIGLNVKADNTAAISTYRSIGFQQTATYGEYLVTRRN